MADEPTPERQQQPATVQSEKPVADSKGLTITVVEPAKPDIALPEVPVRTPPYAELPRLPRWYLILIVLTVVALFLSYEVQYRDLFRRAALHRWLPPRIVRYIHSAERHMIGHRIESSRYSH